MTPRPDFQTLFEALPGLFLVMDPQLIIAAASDAYLAATKTSRDEIVGRPFFDVFPNNPDNPTADGEANGLESFHRVIRTGRIDVMPVQRHDTRRPASEGGGFEERYWRPVNAPVLGPDGAVEWIILRVEDVTEIVRLQQAGAAQGQTLDLLREALAAREDAERARQRAMAVSARLDSLLRALPVGVSFSEDTTCREITGNPALLAQFEISEQDNFSASAPDPTAAGRRVRYFRAGRELTDAELPLQRAVAENALIPPMEIDVTLPSGRRWTLEAQAAPVLGPGGRVLAGIAITTDITERKQAEEELRESRAKLAAALNSMTDAVFIADLDGRLIEANDAFATFHRFATKSECPETLWDYLDILELLNLDGSAAPLENWPLQRAMRGEVVTDAEYLLRRKDTGETWYASYNFAPIRDEAGAIAGAVIVGHDITERKQLEAAVLRIGEEERTRVAADLHDGVCQDLTGIQYFANLLSKQLAEEKHPLVAEAQRIEDAIVRTARQTRQVARGLNPVVADGTGLMTALRQLAAANHEPPWLECVFECPAEVSINDAAVANGLYRVLQEALQNALRHSRATHIALHLSETTDEITALLRDNGCGIPADLTNSTGMGLRVMRYRTELIGGNFTVLPGLAGGTEVLCRVPKPTTPR